MKAYVLQDVGDINLRNIPEPEPGMEEVLVKVRACGICGSDIPRIFQSGAHRMPLIPGHEFSGEVAAVGKGADERLIGKRVGVFPLIPCRECGPCIKGRHELCRNYSYLGSRRDGGFAEYVSVPSANLIELPKGVSFETAAMLEPMAVAVHAMRRVLPQIGGNAAVCGLGTIGLLLVAFLMDAGTKDIFVVGNKGFQKKAVLRIGIPEENFCDSRKEEVGRWLMERTNGEGADVFFECVGKNETVSQAVELTAAAGSVCLVGNPFSDIRLHKDIYWKILKNQLTVTGTWNSSFTGKAGDDWNYAVSRLTDGCFFPERLISHRFPLEELWEGFRIMRDKTEDYMKIMGVMG